VPAGVNHYPDPGLSFGHFTVLPRTDGKWAVVDDRRALGARTIKAFSKKDLAVEAAQKWHSEGR
jgi:hypothetical protein